jgi:hypothetical protein
MDSCGHRGMYMYWLQERLFFSYSLLLSCGVMLSRAC